jgi:DNA-binding NtrC family response regulator
LPGLILVVGDDDAVRQDVTLQLSSLGYRVHCSRSGAAALSRLAALPNPAAVLLDLPLPEGNGLELLDQLRRAQTATPVIVLSTAAQSRTVVDAVRRGASDYLIKPFAEHDLALALRSVLEVPRPRERSEALGHGLDPPDRDFITSNPHLLRIKEICSQVADTDAPVLLLGESGVGKEVVARCIHAYSQRRTMPFVKVNCAALPQDLLESELFGYDRGAFSGAAGEKPGMFELADRGTLLLDEIGEMSGPLQAKVLHVLHDGHYTRLGGRRPVKSDARVIASTNAVLEEAVAAGRFRADLYFRLNVVRIDIPPLRARREDIPLLYDHFLRTYAVRYGRPARELPRVLREAFAQHDWPGNVRELENAIRRYTILPDVEMALADLRRNSPPVVALPGPRLDLPVSNDEHGPRDESLSLRTVSSRAAEEAERKLVRRVLSETNWNRKQAARRLKISYKALLNKLKRWAAEEQADAPGSEKAVPKAAAPLRPRLAEVGRSTA